MLGRQLWAGRRSAGDSGAARPRRDLGLCAGRRLSRGDQGAAQGAGALARRAGRRRREGVRRHRRRDGEAAARRRAGLGWQGKHTNLVSREFGSWLFLGAIFTTLELPPDEPEIDHCGTLPGLPRRLPDRGVPAALPARCAALHLLPDDRAQGPDPARAAPARWATASMAATIASRSARGTSSRKWDARRSSPRARRCARPKLAELARLDDAAFRALFARSPVKRTGRDRFVRNVLIAIGNSGDPALAAEAERLLDDASPLVRGAAVWALGQLEPQRLAGLAPRAARNARPDVSVREEWDAGSPRRRPDVHARSASGSAIRRAHYVAEFGGAFRPHRRHGAHARERGGASRPRRYRQAQRSRCSCSTANRHRRTSPPP